MADRMQADRSRPPPPSAAGRRRGPRRGLLADALVALAAIAAVLAAAAPWQSAARVSSDVGEIHHQLAQRLAHRHLDVREITCLRNGRSYDGARVVRCNVNFGDPHVVAYCSVLRDGVLVTSAEDRSIPCGHDDAGWSAPVQVFGG